MFAILSVIYLLQIIGIQESLQQAITQLGLDTSKYAYVYEYIMEQESDVEKGSAESDLSDDIEDSQRGIKETNNIEETNNLEEINDLEETKQSSVEALVATAIDSAYFKIMLSQYVDEEQINNSCIKGGMSGISTFMSNYMSEGDDIDIVISYFLKIPVPFFSISDIPVLQRVRVRGFTGYKPESKKGSNEEEQEGDKTLVYIAETGNVYHTTKECSHLKLSIEEAEYSHLDNLRNDSGGKYYSCSICIAKTEHNNLSSIYITKSGDRYHSSLNCSGLKRTVRTITLNQVGNKTLCTRCGATNK